MYLAVVMEWYSLSRLSYTMESEFCVDALEEAMRRYDTLVVFDIGRGRGLRVSPSRMY